MNLNRYLHENNISYVAFADMLKCNHVYLSRIARGLQVPGERLALYIEVMTKGEVTAKEILNPSPLNFCCSKCGRPFEEKKKQT